MGTIVLLAVLASPGWLTGFAYGAWVLVETVGENKSAISATNEIVTEMAEALGGMTQLFGNAEILEDGVQLTAAINTSSDANRFDQGQELLVTNKGDRSRSTITVIVRGQFDEGNPYHLLDLSAAAGRALRAPQEPEEGDERVKIQVSIEPVPDRKADD